MDDMLLRNIITMSLIIVFGAPFMFFWIKMMLAEERKREAERNKALEAAGHGVEVVGNGILAILFGLI